MSVCCGVRRWLEQRGPCVKNNDVHVFPEMHCRAPMDPSTRVAA